MITFSITTIFLVQCVLIKRGTFSRSTVRTYQLRRLNNSAYLITSSPGPSKSSEFDYYNRDASNRHLFSTRYQRKLPKFRYDWPKPSRFHNTNKTHEINFRTRMTAEEISHVRQKYFRDFFATMKKHDLPATRAFPNATGEADNPESLFRNIKTARNLASMLMQQARIYDDHMPHASQHNKAYAIEIRPLLL